MRTMLIKEKLPEIFFASFFNLGFSFANTVIYTLPVSSVLSSAFSFCTGDRACADADDDDDDDENASEDSEDAGTGTKAACVL